MTRVRQLVAICHQRIKLDGGLAREQCGPCNVVHPLIRDTELTTFDVDFQDFAVGSGTLSEDVTTLGYR